MMQEAFALMDWQDLLALLLFLGCWFFYASYSRQANRHEQSLLALTNRYRMEWMRQMLKRDNRMVDTTVMGNLMRSITFFASTSIFFLLGLITMLGYHDRATAIIDSIPFAKPASGLLWEVKIFLLMIIFIYAFFKFTWSLRQYNFACIFVVSAPAHNERRDEHEDIAHKGVFLVENAAEYFNNGLRAYYFGLAALAWFVHPYLFMVATLWVIMVTYRREFMSKTLKNLM